MTIWTNIRGATAIEYGLIVALIAVSAIPAIMGVAAQENQTYQQAAGGLGYESRHGGEGPTP